jgi:hypothetical protein
MILLQASQSPGLKIGTFISSVKCVKTNYLVAVNGERQVFTHSEPRAKNPVSNDLQAHPTLNHAGLELEVEEPLEEKVKQPPGPSR